MTKKLLDKLEKVALNYKDWEYCECGCKGSDAHSTIGVQRFEDVLMELKPHDVLELVRLARKSMFFDVGDKILLGDPERKKDGKKDR